MNMITFLALCILLVTPARLETTKKEADKTSTSKEHLIKSQAANNTDLPKAVLNADNKSHTEKASAKNYGNQEGLFKDNRKYYPYFVLNSGYGNTADKSQTKPSNIIVRVYESNSKGLNLLKEVPLDIVLSRGIDQQNYQPNQFSPWPQPGPPREPISVHFHMYNAPIQDSGLYNHQKNNRQFSGHKTSDNNNQYEESVSGQQEQMIKPRLRTLIYDEDSDNDDNEEGYSHGYDPAVYPPYLWPQENLRKYKYHFKKQGVADKQSKSLYPKRPNESDNTEDIYGHRQHSTNYIRPQSNKQGMSSLHQKQNSFNTSGHWMTENIVSETDLEAIRYYLSAEPCSCS